MRGVINREINCFCMVRRRFVWSVTLRDEVRTERRPRFTFPRGLRANRSVRLTAGPRLPLTWTRYSIWSYATEQFARAKRSSCKTRARAPVTGTTAMDDDGSIERQMKRELSWPTRRDSCRVNDDLSWQIRVIGNEVGPDTCQFFWKRSQWPCLLREWLSLLTLICSRYFLIDSKKKTLKIPDEIEKK